MKDRIHRRAFLKHLLASGAALGSGAAMSAFFGACGKEEPPRNVILITADTLRADFLHSYDNTRIQTPNIDMLAGQGVLFRNCFCQSTTTNPSHASILTSLYPKDHHVYLNSDFLPQNIRMVSEDFRDSGFTTFGAVSAAHLNPEVSGFGKGFSTFIPCEKNQVTASATNKHVLSWLKENYRIRFFMWLHYFDPHMPYAPPKAFAEMYYDGDPRDAQNTSMAEAVYPKKWGTPKYLEGITDIRYLIAQYMGEVSYLDAEIGELQTGLNELGLNENTLIIFTADHGESLGEHHIYFAHAGLFEVTVRVPLIMWCPPLLSPDVIDSLVMSVDIVPTILELCRVQRTAKVRGESLLPLIRGSVVGIHDSVYCEHVDGNQAMIRDRKWKYIKSLKDWHFNERFTITQGNGELYDVHSDPGEMNNRAHDFPRLVEDRDRKMVAWLEDRAIGTKPADKPAVSEEVREHLRALGYLQ